MFGRMGKNALLCRQFCGEYRKAAKNDAVSCDMRTVTKRKTQLRKGQKQKQR